MARWYRRRECTPPAYRMPRAALGRMPSGRSNSDLLSTLTSSAIVSHFIPPAVQLLHLHRGGSVDLRLDIVITVLLQYSTSEASEASKKMLTLCQQFHHDPRCDAAMGLEGLREPLKPLQVRRMLLWVLDKCFVLQQAVK